MQSLSWDNYQYVLAIHRCQTLSGAARFLGVNETTVSRRLVQTEQFLKLRLFSRRATGLEATDAGLRLIHRLERAKFELDEAQVEVATGTETIGGSLRVAGDSLLLNHMLVPSLREFFSQYPALSCELITQGDNGSLKDCDVALRYGDSLSAATLASHETLLLLGKLEFAVFTAKSLSSNCLAQSLPWLVQSSLATDKLPDVVDATGHVPYATNVNRLRVVSADTLLSYALAGLGKCVLPKGVGLQNPQLVMMDGFVPSQPRDLVRICQLELLGTSRLMACDDWLRRCVSTFNDPDG